MTDEIKLIKNNGKRDLTDLEWVQEFYEFLQGDPPANILTNKIKLSKNKAFTIIWYLQEQFSILPDHICQCDRCGDLYDSYEEGYHSEKKSKFYCGNCTTFKDEEQDN